MLEVRNNDWTDENIEDYLKLLNHMIEYELKLFNNDIKKIAINTFTHSGDLRIKNNIPYKPSPMNPLSLYFLNIIDNKIKCSLGHCCCIECYNLEFVPCHRLAYPQLRGGKFLKQEDKIIDIEPLEGINCYFNLTLYNSYLRPKCINCEFKHFCMRGCLGSQQEAMGDYNICNPSVCKLFIAKYKFLFHKYWDLGVIQYFLNDPDNIFKDWIKEKEIIKQVLRQEEII